MIRKPPAWSQKEYDAMIAHGRKHHREMSPKKDQKLNDPRTYEPGLLDSEAVCECDTCRLGEHDISYLFGDVPVPKRARDHHVLCHCRICTLARHIPGCGCMYCDKYRPGYNRMHYVMGCHREWHSMLSMTEVHAMIQWKKSTEGLLRVLDAPEDAQKALERVIDYYDRDDTIMNQLLRPDPPVGPPEWKCPSDMLTTEDRSRDLEL